MAICPDVTADPLSVILADGELSCEENLARNDHNSCPASPPVSGVDAAGISWTADTLLGFIPNPLHWPLQCFRGTSPTLGSSGVQCCYDENDQLITRGPIAGTFDYASPSGSLLSPLFHWWLDVSPCWRCGTCGTGQ